VQFVLNYEDAPLTVFGVAIAMERNPAVGVLYDEGAKTPRMMSVGLHCRLVGRPGASRRRWKSKVSASGAATARGQHVRYMAAPEVAGRFARAALAAGEGEVCAVFRRSFYLRVQGERGAWYFACIGERSLGHGPLNALVAELDLPELGEKLFLSMDNVPSWQPEPLAFKGKPDLAALCSAATARTPEEGLACLIVGGQNALANHAQPALDALDAWLAGNRLGGDAEALIGLGPGLTPSGDDYLGGMLIALHACERRAQAESLWRWLEPRLSRQTGPISAAHLAAAAVGEAHEALHKCLECVMTGQSSMGTALDELDAVGHCSGWDALAGALAVLRTA
jgi:hypothetical protein